MLRAGVARWTITPPVGLTMAGYAAREGVAQDKDSELYATALVMDDERTRIAIIAFDLVFLQEPFVTSLRREVGRRIGVPQANVLLNFSHTHCGPTSEGLHYDEDEQQDLLRQGYAARLRTEIPALADIAARRLAPVRLGSGVGEARIGINRRERQEDGSIILGENPGGVVDHEVRVLRIDDLTGKPVAVVFSHGCHTVTMGPKCLRWSSDYVGPARDLVEQHTGAMSLFLQANAGDINPVTGIGWTEDNSNEKNRLGRALGGEALKVHSSIYTESVRGTRTLIGSLAKIPYYPRIPVQHEPAGEIDVREEMLELPLEDLPSRETAEAVFNKWDSELSGLRQRNISGAPVNIASLFRRSAIGLRNAVAKGSKLALNIPIQAIRVGDVAIAAAPGETFSAEGLAVKRQSPFSQTLFLGYSNGCVCYIPTRDAYPERGWSVTDRYYVPDMIFQAYQLPMALTPDCGERIVSKSLDLLRQLHGAEKGAVAGGADR